MNAWILIIAFLLLTNAQGGQLGSYTLKNWGLTNNLASSHVHAPEAWNITQGSRNVIVAVLDTGIDPNHRDLRYNLWRDPSDGSVYGWDFVNNSPNPVDSHGHGSHVSGIIGAMEDSTNGASGVAHKVSIMSVKYYSDLLTGAQNLHNTVKALNYAIDHGARIINYSGGGPEFSEDEYLALKRAEEKGILVVVAAGNDNENIDLVENYFYPASYPLSNMIVVGASDIRNNRLVSSNWGDKVDLSAPGENIYSTLPYNHFGYMSGTSQATAFVTGIAVLLLSKNPNLTPSQVKSLIIRSVDVIPQLKGKNRTNGRANAFSALNLLKTVAKFPKTCKFRE